MLSNDALKAKKKENEAYEAQRQLKKDKKTALRICHNLHKEIMRRLLVDNKCIIEKYDLNCTTEVFELVKKATISIFSQAGYKTTDFYSDLIIEIK